MRIAIELFSRVLGYYIFFNAISGAAGGDPLSFLCFFGLADIVLIGGAIIGSGERWSKPTFTSVGGAIIGWIVYILIVPFVYLVRDAWCIFRIVISFPFRRSSGRSSGGSGRSNGSHSSSGSYGVGAGSSSTYGRDRSRGGERVFNNALKNICRQYSGYDYLGKATRVDYTFSHSIFSHAITVTLEMVFTVESGKIYSEYEAKNERNDIENYISRFDTNSIQNDIVSELEELRYQYDDLDNAWGIEINGKTDIRTV